MKHTLHFLCIPALMFALSCSQKTDKKTNSRPSIIVDKKELECKRKNWNRVHPSTGYVKNVVTKQEYKQVAK